jgi:formate hydrogenlyase subunit 6/NADH:ubiquinone oxidoreductase subunit I
VLLPPTPEEMQKTILARALTVVENYSVNVGKLVKATVPGTNGGFLGKVKEFFQRIIHNIFEPHEMVWGKLLHAESTCTSCGICERICPARNIRMVEPVTHATGGAEKAKPVWGDRCLMCLACLHWCPARAVQHSFLTKKWGRYHHPQIKSKDLILQEAKPVEK